ncbi:hypothetical protein D5086_026083 [Populus alba]|uniref:Uncharacterized protein n=1 Tax=Populus alba TaxID=43335 RepID=A0ACC4B1E9_POPAL
MDCVEMDKERLTAEMALKNSSAVIKIRQRLPDFLQSVRLKYVMLGYGYSCNPATILMFLIVVPLFIATLVQFTGLQLDRFYELWRTQSLHDFDVTTRLAGSAILLFLLAVFWTKRSKPVYLVDFACYKRPEDERKTSIETILKMAKELGTIDDETLRFQRRISTRSGLGEETYISRGLSSQPLNLSMEEARYEAESVMFGALDALFSKTGVEPRDIGILIVNCSLFNPTPSLSSMIVNHYKLRTNIKSYNLGGMGCSAGLISTDLAKDLLKANPDTFGNTSSSSLWYELAYAEAKGRVSEGDRVWQIAFGSGFKCNSAVWKALRKIPAGESKGNPWIDSIDRFLPTQAHLDLVIVPESKEHIRHQRSPPDLDCALHHLPAVPQLKRLVSRLWNEAAHGRGLFLLCSPKLVRPPVERQK